MRLTVPDRGDGICLSVRDHGRGMTEEELALVMEPFEQASNVYVRAEGGTGLGLPIVKQIVELHGGRVWASNRPGGGTTVTVSLPVDVDEIEPAGELA